MDDDQERIIALFYPVKGFGIKFHDDFNYARWQREVLNRAYEATLFDHIAMIYTTPDKLTGHVAFHFATEDGLKVFVDYVMRFMNP